MTNEELVDEILAGRDAADNMATLYQQNLPLINKIINNYAGLAEREDMLQEAYLGLHAAVNGYDPAEGVAFMTYAPYHIRQAIQRYLENNGRTVRLPSFRYQQALKYKRAIASFERERGRRPNDIEIRSMLGVRQQELDEIRTAAMMVTTSLDAPAGDPEDSSTMADTIADPTNHYVDIEQQIFNEELAAKLWPMVDALPSRQATVIRRTFIDQVPLKDIAADCGVSINTISSDKQAALRNLYHRRRYLSQFAIDSWAYERGLRHLGARAFQRTFTSTTEDAALKLIEARENMELDARQAVTREIDRLTSHNQ